MQAQPTASPMIGIREVMRQTGASRDRCYEIMYELKAFSIGKGEIRRSGLRIHQDDLNEWLLSRKGLGPIHQYQRPYKKGIEA